MTMLQFNGILINLSVRHNPRVPVWFATQQLVAANSTISNPNHELDSNRPSDHSIDSDKRRQLKAGSKLSKLNIQNLFKNEDGLKIVNKLLSVNNSKLTSESSLKIISQLSELVNQGVIKITDFNSDVRYKTLCNNLSTVPRNENSKTELKDVVENAIQNSKQKFFTKKLGFFFDMNEIQNFVKDPNMSIITAGKIMSKLAYHKSRVVPVLESLSDHIVEKNEDINLKLSSDILYNMAVLNFYHEVLIGKIVSSLMLQIPDTNKKYNAAIGSILKSFGLLRYRNENVLMELSKWMLQNAKHTRPQEICSFLVTLAILNYSSVGKSEVFQNFTNNLKESDMSAANEWLDVVWALVVLNQAQKDQVESVLNPEFISKLSEFSSVSESKKRKLLNINAAANLIFKQDTGQLFKEHPSICEVTLEKSREQLEFSKGIITALHAFLPSTGCLKTNVNTGMGFSLDAEFYIDTNCNPVLINQLNSKEKEVLRLAIVSQSYYDFCRGEEILTGPAVFQCKLLKLLGYQVIAVPHSEFHLDQKLVERVKYLQDKIQKSVKQYSA